jgi:large subunit ribosomal protein L24
MRLRKNDNVVIISGKDKGKKGKIIRVLPALGKVIVEGINMTKKHQRPRKSGEKGQIMNIAMPLHASNVMIVDPKSGKGSRVGKKKVGGKMIRVVRKSNQEI